jgi:hypothetical protein
MKILLLLFGLLPILFFTPLIVLFTLGIIQPYSEESILAVFSWIAVISIPCMLIFYIIDVWRNTRVAKNQKALWTVVLLCGWFFAFPVYWYLYLWRTHKEIN